MRIWFFTSILAAYSAATIAAPSVSAVNGTVADEQVVTINGTGFGTNLLRIEWLGGASGTIESATNGSRFLSTNRAGWYENGDNDESFIDSRRAWSGRQAIVFDPYLARWRDQRFGLVYDTGSNFTELYSSYVAYLDAGGATSGQWKMIRWCYTNSVTDDSIPNTYMANWAAGPGDFLQIHTGDSATKTNYFDRQALPESGAWYRVETVMKPASSSTASDGEFWARTTRMTDGLVQEQRFTNQKFYADGDTRRFRYIVFQNYMGNLGYDGAPGPTKLWMDDIYISQSQSRVEVCPSATWAQCANRKEIQLPVTWSNSQITVRLNKGAQTGFAGMYLYVVDNTGAANPNGFSLALANQNRPAVVTGVGVR